MKLLILTMMTYIYSYGKEGYGPGGQQDHVGPVSQQSNIPGKYANKYTKIRKKIVKSCDDSSEKSKKCKSKFRKRFVVNKKYRDILFMIQ